MPGNTTSSCFSAIRTIWLSRLHRLLKS